MTQRYFLWLFVLFLCFSCATLVKTLTRFKNPKVENKKVVSKYFTQVFRADSNYFICSICWY